MALSSSEDCMIDAGVVLTQRQALTDCQADVFYYSYSTALCIASLLTRCKEILR